MSPLTPGGRDRRQLEERLARLEQMLEEQAEQAARTQAILLEMQSRQAEAGPLDKLHGKADALLRKLYFEEPGTSADGFAHERFSLLSQHGEDGMTLAILRAVGVANQRFVEIGCGGNGGNSGMLAKELGWSGAMFDADPEKAVIAQQRFNPERVKVITDWVTRENVNQLLSANGIAGEIDLMSIDIDGNDYWVWEALTAINPRLVIMEYNAFFGHERAVVVPYDEAFNRHKLRPIYFGSSLRALTELARTKGYRLVAVEPTGVNAFFLRSDLGPEIKELDPESAFHGRVKIRPKTKIGRNRPVTDFREDLWSYIEEADLPLVDLDDPGREG